MDPTDQQRITQLASTTKFCLQDFGGLLDDQELLGRHGIPVTKRGKNIFANMLANLVRRSFKLEAMGERHDDL